MGLSFRKAIRFGPVRVNLSAAGIGLSVGSGGFRAGVDARGRGYGSIGKYGFLARFPLGRIRAPISQPASKPPEPPIDLQGDDEFWLDVAGEWSESTQAALLKAVDEMEALGATEAILPVRILASTSIAFPTWFLVFSDDTFIGALMDGERLSTLWERMRSEGRDGACLGLVVEEDGRRGMKLALDRALINPGHKDRRA